MGKKKKLLVKVADERKKKGLTISFNMTECLLVSKRGSPGCELHIGDDKIKPKFKYLTSVITNENVINLKHIEIVTVTF